MTQTLVSLLSEQEGPILAAASASLARAHLPHYEGAGPEAALDRLRTLLMLVERCARERHLAPILEYAESIARERRSAGVDLGEVQTAMNALEEVIWHEVLAELPPEEQGEALGLCATILGAAKDRLACTYVSLAAKRPTHSLDLAGLFSGPREGELAEEC